MKKIQILVIIYIFFLSSICVANQSENLQKLKDLYDDNILTEDQYSEAREKVLRQMEINNSDVATNDSLDTSDINIEAGVSAVVPGYVKKEFTLETWLSDFGLKTEDLSTKIVELMKTTEKTPPPCTTDFCFTTQPEYGGNGATWGNGDAILNKADLINALYRHNPDFNQGNTRIFGKLFEEQNSFHGWGDADAVANGQDGHYCSKNHGCYRLKRLATRKRSTNVDPISYDFQYVNQGLFPDGGINNIKAWNNIDYQGNSTSKGTLTPDLWLEENGLTVEDVVKMLEGYPTTYRIDYRKKILKYNRGVIEDQYKCVSAGNEFGNGSQGACNDSVKWGEGFEGQRVGECTTEEACELTTIDLATKKAEILNADQLVQSLLFLDPDAFGPNFTYELKGYKNMAIQWSRSCDSEGHNVGKCTFEITNPNKVVVAEFVENIYELHPWIHPECFESTEEIKESCLAFPTLSPIQDPPIVPAIRPGWQILEGTDMLVINDDDPYWQTEEGLIERPPKIDPGIEYPPETLPGADPKIVPDLTPEQDKPPSDPNPPPKLDDPTVLQPVDPGIEADPNPLPTPDPTDSKVVMTKQEKKQHRIDTETLRRASEGDFSDYVKRELAGAAARLGVTAPKEEDFSQNYQYNQNNQTGSSIDPNCGTPPCDPNPPPKIDPGIEYPPETLPGADPKIVPDLTPEQDKPPSDPNPPPKLDDPTVLQPVDPG